MTLPSSKPNGAFEISWHDDFGYRVSVPNLLEDGGRLKVVTLAEHEAAMACDECGGSGRVPSGIEHFGAHEMVGCEECQGTGKKLEAETLRADGWYRRAESLRTEVVQIAEVSRGYRLEFIRLFHAAQAVVDMNDDPETDEHSKVWDETVDRLRAALAPATTTERTAATGIDPSVVALGALTAEALHADPQLLERAASQCDRHATAPGYAQAAAMLRRDLAADDPATNREENPVTRYVAIVQQGATPVRSAGPVQDTRYAAEGLAEQEARRLNIDETGEVLAWTPTVLEIQEEN